MLLQLQKFNGVCTESWREKKEDISNGREDCLENPTQVLWQSCESIIIKGSGGMLPPASLPFAPFFILSSVMDGYGQTNKCIHISMAEAVKGHFISVGNITPNYKFEGSRDINQFE